MKTKIFGLAVMLSLSAVLGACGGGTPEGTTTTTPAAIGEPTDTGATPAVTTTPATKP